MLRDAKIFCNVHPSTPRDYFYSTIQPKFLCKIWKFKGKKNTPFVIATVPPFASDDRTRGEAFTCHHAPNYWPVSNLTWYETNDIWISSQARRKYYFDHVICTSNQFVWYIILIIAHDYWPVRIDTLIKFKREQHFAEKKKLATICVWNVISSMLAMVTISTLMTTRIMMMMMVVAQWATVLKHVMESHALKGLIVAILNSCSSTP